MFANLKWFKFAFPDDYYNDLPLKYSIYTLLYEQIKTVHILKKYAECIIINK